MAFTELTVFAGMLLIFTVLARSQSKSVSLADPTIIGLLLAGAVALETRSGAVVNLFGVTLVVACTIVAAASDRATGLIFDAATGTGAVAILAWAIPMHQFAATALGAGICGLAMLALHVGTRGSGIGLGDVKLSAVIGGGIGGTTAIAAVGAGFVFGAIWTCAMLALRRVRRGERVAFAPFLAAGSIAFIGFSGVQFGG
jgi:prepilin signal peptidase PulO-like enzyme (type II secretory pathway)